MPQPPWQLSSPAGPHRSNYSCAAGACIGGRYLCAAAIVASATGLFLGPAQAHAIVGGAPLNGRYLVISNGQWAQTNDVYHDEQTVRQEWTINSSCTDSSTCSGTVHSSLGWSAELRYVDSWWTINRELNGWEPCPDGSATPGHQHYQFWGVDTKTGLEDDSNSTLLAGNDITYGDSGACGVNRQLVVNVPVRLQKIDSQ